MIQRGNASEDERVRQLLMRGLDGELNPRERQELEALFETDASLRAEWDRLTLVKEVTSSMALRRPPEEVWENYWASVYSRLERGLGWILLSIGGVVLISYGLWAWIRQLLADTEMPLIVKGALLSAIIGATVLFVSVLREKLFVRRRDPYKDVER